MKALTLTQPWASLIAVGAKRIETRGWPTNYRGPLAIHAGKGLGPVRGKRGYEELCAQEPFKTVLTGYMERLIARRVPIPQLANAIPFGAIVAVCDLVACRPTAGRRGEQGTGPKYADWVHELSNQERAFGDYTPGRYGWVLDNVRALPEPIPARGALLLWEWTPPEGWTL
jgi:hypothetical protein